MVDTRHRDPWPACNRRPIRRNARGFGHGGGGSTPFDPSQIAGLEAWWRGDSYAGGVALDRSGNGRNLAAGGTAPGQVSRAGQLAFQFGGAGFLRGLFGPLPQPLTVYAVLEATSIAGVQRTIFDGVDGTNRVRAFTVSTTSRTVNAGTALTGSTPTTSMEAWAVVYNGASSALYVANFATAALSGAAGSNAMGGLTVGADVAGGNAFVGYIWELLLYSGAHDAATRAQIAGYLNARYAGLQIAT